MPWPKYCDIILCHSFSCSPQPLLHSEHTDLWPAAAWASCKARRCCWTSAQRCWRCADWRCWSSPCWPDRPEPRRRIRKSSCSLWPKHTRHTVVTFFWLQTTAGVAADLQSWTLQPLWVFLLVSEEVKVEVCRCENNTELFRSLLYNERKHYRCRSVKVPENQ